MSGETARQESGWSVDTLKEYVEQRFTDQDRAVQSALLAAKEAVIKAETATEKRFESVNEFRQQLSDQTNTFLSRPEYNAQHKALEDKVSFLVDARNQTEGKSTGYGLSWSIFLGIATLVIAIITAVTLIIFNLNHK